MAAGSSGAGCRGPSGLPPTLASFGRLPVGVVLGLLVAASFGSGDFLGGLGSRRAPTLPVLAMSQVAALVGAVVLVLTAGGPPHARAAWLGAIAGLLNVAAIGCLYRGLALGQMGRVAPIAAVVGAVLPIGWGVAVQGERPGVPALFGIALAVVAAALLSSERRSGRPAGAGRALLLAVAAGLGFGLSLVLFASVSHQGGLWPVLTARGAAFTAVWAALWLTGRRRSLPEVPKAVASGAGALDVGATALLVVALRTNLTAVVAPVASLAPGFTAAHARWYLHEKVSPVQMAGLAVALVALALIAVG